MQPSKLISIWVSHQLSFFWYYADFSFDGMNLFSCVCLNQVADGDDVPEVTTVVHGIISGIKMPFPLKNPDACVDSGLVCPLQKNVNYEYMQTLPVLKIYPKVSVNPQFE